MQIDFGGQTLTIDYLYSYARVSSKQQTAEQGGEGIGRQELLSQEFSARYGVPLDHELSDLGRSGSKGHHIKKGAALGGFLEAIKADQIKPNSALSVESFSRLSRLPIDDALAIFLDIIRSGVALITLMDSSAYTRESLRSSAGEIHKVASLMQAARTEAENKAFYARKTWKGRRDRVTRQCPAWLIVVDGQYIARPEAVAIIIYIFEQCRDGVGLDRIAANLNAKGVPPFADRKRSSAGWYDSYIRKLITQRAVRGETEEHRYEGDKRIPTGIITAPYPPVVSENLWQEANGALAGRRRVTGRKGEEFTNLFSGLAVCSCGAPMRIRVKGNRNHYTYFQCRDAKRGLCPNRQYVNYKPIERILLRQFGEIAHGLDQPTGDAASKVAEQIAMARREAGELEAQYNRLAEAIETKTGTLGARRLASLESDHEAKMEEVIKLEKILNAIRTARPATEEIAALRRHIAGLDRLPASDRYTARTRINAGLQRILGAIVFDPSGKVTVRLDKPPYGDGPMRSIQIVDAVPEGAIRLTTAEDVLAALKAGDKVVVTPPD